MKKAFILIFFFAAAIATQAQSTVEAEIKAQVEAFNKAVFVDKDSVALEQLLAKEVTYGHSGGKLEDRAEMIKGAIANKSVYEGLKTEVGVIKIHNATAVVRHILSAQEKNVEGKISPLKLQVLQVWIKEKKAWKLVARQAVKVAV